MSTDGLVWWAESLPESEKQLMLIRAAKDHTAKFTNPEMIGMEWSKTLGQRGYNALCPYARNYMAHRYLTYCEDLGQSRRVSVR